MSTNFCFCISAFSLPYSSSTWWKILTHQILHEIGLVHNSYEPGQFTLHSNRLVTYSCDHISGPPWTDFHQIWAAFFFFFFIMLYRYMVGPFKMLKCKRSFCDVITSVLYGHCGIILVLNCDILSHLFLKDVLSCCSGQPIAYRQKGLERGIESGSQIVVLNCKNFIAVHLEYLNGLKTIVLFF